MSIDVAFRHRYGKFVLEIAFCAERPGVTALFGPSGAGKTSTVNAIAGLLRPDEGRIAVNGRVLFASAKKIWLPPEERRVGCVFQDARLFPHMSVARNLRFGWRRARNPTPESEVARIVHMLGLMPLLDRKPSGLSGGEKGRVALGRALLSSPEILLLDEPLAALDTARKNEIFPYLERLRGEARVPILYVTHSLDEVSRLADTVVLVKNGCVAASGPVFDILADFMVADFTGGSPYGAIIDTRIVRHLKEGLTVLAFEGGELVVPSIGKPEGTRFRTRIRAEDVMLALQEPKAISANNVLPAKIAAIRDAGESHADIRLLCGPTTFVARITRSSCARLSLEPGIEVFAIVKSVTVAPQTGPLANAAVSGPVR